MLKGNDRASLLLIGARKEEALKLAEEFIGPSPKIEKGIHPDIHILEPEGKSHLHPMASIQQLIRESSLPPYEGKAKAFLIFEAEKMLSSSSNALLKILEEPPERTFYLLMTDFPDQLLPTLRSRLFPLSFSKQKEETTIEIASYLALAKAGDWPTLLDRLPELEETPLDEILAAVLKAEKGDLFLAERVEEAREAAEVHVKPRTILLHLFLSIGACPTS